MIDNKTVSNEFPHFDSTKVSWEPLTNTSTSTPTHKLKQVDAHRVVCAPIKNYRFVLILLAIIGMSLSTYAVLNYKSNENSIMTFIIGLVFVLCAISMLFTHKAKVFDKKRGYFWVGKFNANTKPIRLSDIKALQIIFKTMSADYTSYELNIIDLNSCRYNVLNHGGQDAEFIQASYTLGAFLNVPVWHFKAINHTAHNT